MGQAMSALTGVRAPAGSEHAMGSGSAAATSSATAGPSQHGVQAHDGQIGSRAGGGLGSAVIPPRASLNDLPVEVFDQIIPILNPRDIEALANASRGIRRKVLSGGSQAQYLHDFKKKISCVQNANDLRRALYINRRVSSSNFGAAPFLSIESAPAAWKVDLLGLLQGEILDMENTEQVESIVAFESAVHLFKVNPREIFQSLSTRHKKQISALEAQQRQDQEELRELQGVNDRLLNFIFSFIKGLSRFQP
jgi:hypothetical protein